MRNPPVRAEPLELQIDDEGFLVELNFHDGWIEPALPVRRDYFGYDFMDEREKAEFLSDWSSFDEGLFELGGKAVAQWTARDRAFLDAVEVSRRDWLNGRVDPDQLSPRDLARDTEYGAAVEIFHALGPRETCRIGLREAPFGAPGMGGYGIYYGGEVGALNEAFAALGINAVVRTPQEMEEDA